MNGHDDELPVGFSIASTGDANNLGLLLVAEWSDGKVVTAVKTKHGTAKVTQLPSTSRTVSRRPRDAG